MSFLNVEFEQMFRVDEFSIKFPPHKDADSLAEKLARKDNEYVPKDIARASIVAASLDAFVYMLMTIQKKHTEPGASRLFSIVKVKNAFKTPNPLTNYQDVKLIYRYKDLPVFAELQLQFCHLSSAITKHGHLIYEKMRKDPHYGELSENETVTTQVIYEKASEKVKAYMKEFFDLFNDAIDKINGGNKCEEFLRDRLMITSNGTAFAAYAMDFAL